MDVDEGRHIVDIEILDASKRLRPLELSNIIIEKFRTPDMGAEIYATRGAS